jgi:diaminohydroxyphosphoribosylaminopyrimidine deaminase / 5-amino-6-(5-phosphoribosylamino)uracil reductase
LLGSLFDARAIDEVHIFIAPKLCGGESAPSPIAGHGLDRIADALSLDALEVQHIGPDLYLTGRVAR